MTITATTSIVDWTSVDRAQVITSSRKCEWVVDGVRCNFCFIGISHQVFWFSFLLPFSLDDLILGNNTGDDGGGCGGDGDGFPSSLFSFATAATKDTSVIPEREGEGAEETLLQKPPSFLPSSWPESPDDDEAIPAWVEDRRHWSGNQILLHYSRFHLLVDIGQVEIQLQWDRFCRKTF